MLGPNSSKYIFPLSIVIVCLPYLQMFLISFGVDINIIIYIWIGIFMSIAFTFSVLPLKEYKVHQKPAAGKEFQLGPVAYMNHTGSDKLLGVENEITEVRIDWTDSQTRVLKETEIWLRARRAVLCKESRIEKEKRLIKTDAKEQKSIDAVRFDDSDIPAEQIAQLLAKHFNITASKEEIDLLMGRAPLEEMDSEEEAKEEEEKVPIPQTEEEYRKSLIIPEPNEIILDKSKQTPQFVKPRIIDLSELGFTTSEQKRLLTEMYIYKVDLYYPEHLDGYEYLEFSQAFYILPGPFKEVLATRPMKVSDYDGYVIDVQGCQVMWCCLGFVKGKVPLLLLYASENLVKLQSAEVIKSNLMKSSTIHHLKFKTMEWLLNESFTEQDPFYQKIEALETQNEGLRDQKDYLLQEYLSDTFVKASKDTQTQITGLRSELASAKKWKAIAVFSMFFLCILMFAFFFLLLPSINGVNNIDPPVEEAAELIRRNVKFLKITKIIGGKYN